MKKKLLELFFQIIPVMIGVYLGFLVSNWSMNNEKKHDAKILMKNIFSEIELNEDRIEEVLEYHIMLRDSSRFYLNTTKQFDGRPPAFFKGTRFSNLMNSAYNTGIQTGIINELPLDQIQAINQLYTYQNNYNAYGNMMMSNLISKDFSRNEESIRKIVQFLSLTMTDMVLSEQNLLKGYEDIKEKLNIEH